MIKLTLMKEINLDSEIKEEIQKIQKELDCSDEEIKSFERILELSDEEE